MTTRTVKPELGRQSQTTLTGKYFYGWTIVLVALVSLGFWMGIRSAFSVFYVALLDDFSWNRGASAGVQSLALLAYTACSPLVGGMIDRYGPRRIVPAGIAVHALGLMLCATIQDLGQFYLYYGVIAGAGITAIGIVAYSAIISHWFERKRGLASGLAVSGMGLGTFVLVPATQQAISLWGWRTSYFILGVMVLVVLMPLNTLLLRHTPAELGLYPDGEREPQSAACVGVAAVDCRPITPWTLPAVLADSRFWSLMAFASLAISAVFVVVVHNVRLMVDHGLSKMSAAMMFAMVGIVSSLFRIFWGWLSDRIGREITYTLGALCGCLGIAALVLLEATGRPGFVYAYFMLFGMGWGVTAPMFMAVAADLFKGRIFGLIYGFVEGGVGVAAAFGAWFAGFMFDRTGSYRVALIYAIGALLVSVVFAWTAAPRKVRGQR